MTVAAIHERGWNCTVIAGQLSTQESEQILADPNAMKAVIDGSGTLPPATTWIKFYQGEEENFCGAMAVCNMLPNKLQVEFHLFYLSTARKIFARPFCELAYLYALQYRLQPYTVVQAKPALRYMVNFMRRIGAVELPLHGRYYYMPPVNWQPRTLDQVILQYTK